LNAFAKLPKDLHWHFTHVGGGKLSNEMKALADQLGIADRISWLGARDQTEVIEAYRRADMFTLASRIDADGDRDGLPNVMMEAQLQCLPVVATNISAIPEIVTSGENGLLVPSEDSDALSEALHRLITNAEERQKMGQRGYEVVHERFSFQSGIDRLAVKFGLPVASK
jgi:glycosyltransferase involved in cell wall biosynthesis